MKKILLFAILLFPIFCKAQSDTTSANKHEQYCMVIATAKFFSNKVSIEVDFGQQTSFWHGSHGDQIKDSQGKVVAFNSVVDALNYMSSQGWLFVNAYALSEGSSGKVLNYIMRKPAQ